MHGGLEVNRRYTNHFSVDLAVVTLLSFTSLNYPAAVHYLSIEHPSVADQHPRQRSDPDSGRPFSHEDCCSTPKTTINETDYV